MPLPTFLLYPQLNDARTQLAYLQMIDPLWRQPDSAMVRALWQTYYTGSYAWEYRGITDRYTSTIGFKFGTNNVVLCAGTQGTRHVLSLVNGWANYANMQPTQVGISDAFFTAATGIYNAFPAGWWAGEQVWYLAGHSFGGAQAQALARLILLNSNRAVVFGTCYGSPRPGTVRFRQTGTGLTWTRWYNLEDPVPKIPPHTDELAPLQAAIPDRFAIGMNAQVQAPVGQQIGPIGNVTQQEESSNPLSTNQLALASWLTSTNAFGAQAHSIAEYVRRFQLIVTATTGTIRSRPGDQTPDMPLVETRTVRNRMIVAAIDPLISAGTFPPPQTQQVLIPIPGQRFRVTKFDGDYYVTYDAMPYACGPGKRAARALAKQFNASLKPAAMMSPINSVTNPGIVSGVE